MCSFLLMSTVISFLDLLFTCQQLFEQLDLFILESHFDYWVDQHSLFIVVLCSCLASFLLVGWPRIIWTCFRSLPNLIQLFQRFNIHRVWLVILILLVLLLVLSVFRNLFVPYWPSKYSWYLTQERHCQSRLAKVSQAVMYYMYFSKSVEQYCYYCYCCNLRVSMKFTGFSNESSCKSSF